MLSFDRYSRDDVIGEVLLPVYEALEDMKNESMGKKAIEESNSSALEPTLSRDIAPRCHKVSLVSIETIQRGISAQNRIIDTFKKNSLLVIDDDKSSIAMKRKWKKFLKN